MSQTDEQFAKILIEAVDSGLLILGESSRKAILYHLEKDYSVTKEKIPERMEAFMEGLQSIFGAGALVIERSISERLYSELGVKYEEKKRCRFVDCVKQAKKMWSESSRM
jgi:hypothetical protein